MVLYYFYKNFLIFKKIEKKNLSLMFFLMFFYMTCNGVGDRDDMMDPSYLLKVIEKLEQGENIIFTKYGDGEYLCMRGDHGCNCDNDKYHPWLGKKLKESLVSLSRKKNTYIGKWWTAEVYEYCNSIARANSVVIPWAWYHLFINDDLFLKYDYMYQFVQFIVQTKRKKILICNAMNSKLKKFFRADVYIEVPPSSWSFQYDQYKNEVEKNIEKDAILLISAGLCSKVLIDDVTNKYDVSCIDLGSSFDLLARRRVRWSHPYEDELLYYKDFIPADWD